MQLTDLDVPEISQLHEGREGHTTSAAVREAS